MPQCPTAQNRALNRLAFSYVKFDTVCAVDRYAESSIARAYTTKDEQALLGLVQREKAIYLTKGTRFDVSSSDGNGFVFGFVRSGREIGRDCAIPQAFLQDEPTPKQE